MGLAFFLYQDLFLYKQFQNNFFVCLKNYGSLIKFCPKIIIINTINRELINMRDFADFVINN